MGIAQLQFSRPCYVSLFTFKVRKVCAWMIETEAVNSSAPEAISFYRGHQYHDHKRVLSQCCCMLVEVRVWQILQISSCQVENLRETWTFYMNYQPTQMPVMIAVKRLSPTIK